MMKADMLFDLQRGISQVQNRIWWIMAAPCYSHDSQNITIQNCIHGSSDMQQLKLPKGEWTKKLDKVKRKVEKFNIDTDIQWRMTINGQNIDPSNVIEFESILSKIPPPINIKITEVNL